MATQKKHPIILAHGITRPDYFVDLIMRKLNLYEASRVYDKFHYFKGIAGHLRQHGFEVYHTSVSFAADVETRAQDLAREIQNLLVKTGHQKVHIIAHSLGGLDARHAIVKQNLADKVATLTTLGTPHLGACVADWFMEHRFNKIITPLRKLINLEGFKSLTTAACRAFNDCARDAEAANPVFYQVYASSQKRALTFWPFQKTWQVTFEREGDNEGLVSVKSQKWESQLVGKNGTVKIIPQHDFPVPADHINQMGWWHPSGLRPRETWNGEILKGKKQYELTIKNVYLKMAQEVSNVF